MLFRRALFVPLRSRPSRFHGPVLLLLAGVVPLVALSLTACGITVTSTSNQAKAGTASSGSTRAGSVDSGAGPHRTVSDLLALPTSEESHATDYDRDSFGRRWADIDGNGCGQRDDVLARDLTNVRTKEGACTVLSGRLVDPWTGTEVAFTKTEPAKVQIDHVVALAEAWRSGAWAWTDVQRERYANDLSVLVATEGKVNRDKSDKDAATWSPVGASRACVYARHVVDLKTVFGLSVDRAERTALRRHLESCD
ncbi:MAG: hypothetical protein QG608_3470 [Actinomycetota bacterium]|nr:hypothetical protein [Actinomycetota bacterium]